MTADQLLQPTRQEGTADTLPSVAPPTADTERTSGAADSQPPPGSSGPTQRLVWVRASLQLHPPCCQEESKDVGTGDVPAAAPHITEAQTGAAKDECAGSESYPQETKPESDPKYVCLGKELIKKACMACRGPGK
ncbi:hypothetical protein Y1Q_0012245 [Alligator mississippiensis]|uniref:Uncharacterized protein n=1 Tax=Alligator mississippiensis TaxID=8496 RepID=A0A151NV11_ALLMI|nr:hypothetical protein Y1Q_0012245 [Alligator mississippiensis]